MGIAGGWCCKDWAGCGGASEDWEVGKRQGFVWVGVFNGAPCCVFIMLSLPNVL